MQLSCHNFIWALKKWGHETEKGEMPNCSLSCHNLLWALKSYGQWSLVSKTHIENTPHMNNINQNATPRSGLHIWLHRDEGWQFWGLSTHRKILWKWHQYLFSFNDISKPLDHQAKQTVKQKLNFKFVIAYFFILRFKSNYFKSGLGFQLRYESTNVAPLMLTNKTGQCGGTFLTPNGILTSPSYPGLYPDISECVYTISRPNGTVILLDFLSMDIEYDIACNYDYLEIREGSSEASPLLDKVCGSKVPVPIKSTKSNIWMKWVQIIEYMSFVKNM